MNTLLPDRCAHAYVERRIGSQETAGRWEMIDLDSNLRYRSESYSAIRCNCLCAGAVLPFYGVAYMVWHAVRSPFSAISIFFHTFEEMLTRPSFCVLANLIILPVKHILWSIWKVASTPIYLLALESAALAGLFKPLEGRQYFGAIEKCWRGNPPFAYDFHSNYLVAAFQSYGALDDPSVLSVQFSACRGSAE